LLTGSQSTSFLKRKDGNRSLPGALYYRAKGSARRISYWQLKIGLQRKQMGVINDLLPF